MKKIILTFLLILFIGTSVFVYKLIWGKPLFINHFFERSLIETALSEPEILSVVGIIDNTILDFHSDKLTNASPDHTIESMERSKKQLKTLRSYNRDRLSGQKTISYDMFEWFLQNQVDGEPWMFHNYPVNQTFGIQSQLPAFMDTYHSVSDKKSAENFIARLEAFEEKLSQVSESVLYRAERGVTPPLFVIDHVIREMTDFIDTEPTNHTLYNTFSEKLADVNNLDEETVNELKEQAAMAIQNHVYAGYQLLIDTFTHLQVNAREEVGVWALPDGDEYYNYTIKNHTTLPLTADEIHQTGLDEVSRIEAEMIDRFEEIGISGETIADRFKVLDSMDDMFYPDTEESYKKIIDDYSAMVEDLYERTTPLFNRIPKADVEVRRVPEFSEKTAPFAYYSIPSMDGNRPGIFYINLRDIDKIPKYGMYSLTAHESVPGHHFQLALQQEIENVPTIRNLLPFTAYSEGWALYAEWIISEIGFYDDDPYSDLGRLQYEMFRAVRLVVDTGIHNKRWTREEAINYMLEKTGMPEGDIISEIERYIVMPGQALAYKTGMIYIQQLRDRAEERLGNQFEIAEFNDVILMNGSLPLQLLTEVVENYIEEVLQRST